MDPDEYRSQLFQLGLRGPRGETRHKGKYAHAYKYIADGSTKYLPAADPMTDDQRAEVIEELKRHLEIIELNRHPDVRWSQKIGQAVKVYSTD